MYKIEITASAVAWYGAIVATISVIISSIYLGYMVWKDKRKIKIKISEGIIVPNYYGEDVKIMIEAINTGNRMITLSQVGFSLSNKKHLFIFSKPNTWVLPVELKGGKSFMAWIDKNVIVEDVKKSGAKIKYAWYRDATGKYFKKQYRLKTDLEIKKVGSNKNP